MRSRAVHRARRGRRARVPERGIGPLYPVDVALDFPRHGRDGEGTHPLGATRDTGAANVGHARGDSAREADGRHLSSFLYTGRRRDK